MSPVFKTQVVFGVAILMAAGSPASAWNGLTCKPGSLPPEQGSPPPHIYPAYSCCNRNNVEPILFCPSKATENFLGTEECVPGEKGQFCRIKSIQLNVVTKTYHPGPTIVVKFNAPECADDPFGKDLCRATCAQDGSGTITKQSANTCVTK